MKIIEKIKNLFSDEIEEEIPVKKEVIKVEIPSPTKEESIENIISDNETIKKEEKINTPIYFDDKDFDALDYKPKEEKKEPTKSSYMLKKKEKEKDEKEPFKPSPIISPVYGVLDKNYSKDDIRTKQHGARDNFSSKKQVTIDDVRKKAYGTLEQDLEDVLVGNDDFAQIVDEVINDTDVIDDTLDIFEELDIQEEIVEEKTEEIDIFSKNKDITIEEAEKKLSDEEEIKEILADENLTEGDLFNLIDSMYEKGAEEDGM